MAERQIKKELTRIAALFEEECESAGDFDATTVFRDFVQRWINDYAYKNLRINTLNVITEKIVLENIATMLYRIFKKYTIKNDLQSFGCQITHRRS